MRKEFSELKTVTADQLMYVKEDLILPQHYTFYDFIVTKVETRFYNHALRINIKWIICRLEVRAVRCSNLTCGMTSGWLATPLSRRRKATREKCCSVVGTSATSTFSLPADGNRTTRPKFTTSTLSVISTTTKVSKLKVMRWNYFPQMCICIFCNNTISSLFLCAALRYFLVSNWK